MAQTGYANSGRSMEDKAAKYANTAQEKIGDAVDEASARVRDASDTVRDYTNRAADRVEESVHNYPLSTVAGAVAIGFLLGAVLKR